MKRILLAGILALTLALPSFAATQVRENAVWYRVHLGTGLTETRVTDAEIAAFIDSFVTERFPDGMTIIAARGQWSSKEHGLTREITTVIDIQCGDTPENSEKIKEIAEEYVRRFTRARASCFVKRIPNVSTTLYYP